MKILNNEQFHAIKAKALIVDVRTPYEYKTLDRFKFSHNIPVNTLLANYQNLLPNKQQTIVVVCNGGNRSGYITDFLTKQKYQNVYLLDSGIYGYFREYPRED